MKLLLLVLLLFLVIPCLAEDYNALLKKAVNANDTELVKMLIDKGADVNYRESRKSSTLLAIARKKGFSELAILLEKHGAKTSSEEDALSDSNLLRSVSKNKPDEVKKFIGAGASVNIQNKYDGKTPLFLAAQRGYREIAEILINNGAEVNASDKYGNTPLMKAVISNKIELVKLFLEMGADINKQDKWGKNSLMMAVEKNRIEIVSLLLNKGADPKIQTPSGETVLDIARKKGYLDIVKEILKTLPKK